jgi:uncharacterized tellurite resistance protein B-like protein
MINRIKALLEGPRTTDKGVAGHDETQLAAAALLVEAARMDANFDESEWSTIRRMVQERFDLDQVEADALIATADEEVEGSAEIYRFAKVIKDRFEMDERVHMIEMLWRVVYADGEVHDYEANLLRRVAGLIYVSDRDSGTARKRVLAELSLAEQ